MIALNTECQHENRTKHGKNRNGSQLWKCKDCGATVSDVHVHAGPLGSMQADESKVFMALDMLTEGMGLRAVSRVTGLDKATISKAVMIISEKCQAFLDQNIQGVSVKFAEVDELWNS